MMLINLIFLSLSSFAQTYETVVEDIVFDSSSRLVIDEAMIEKSQSPDLPSLLAVLGNITITSTSFQPTSISIRGGDSGHVLILVDGIPFYDPSTVQRTGNLATLNIKSIKRIEIVKGSQSVLYGGQALGGVIKIETLPKQDSAETLVELGTQDHFLMGAEVAQEKLFTRGLHQQRKTESPARNSSQAYASELQNLDVGYQLKGQAEGFVKASFLKDQSFSPSSDINYRIIDVNNFKISSEQSFLSSQIRLKNKSWEPHLIWGLQQGKRQFIFPLSNVNSTALQENYDSNFQFFRLDVRPFRSDTLAWDLGLNYSQEYFNFKEFGITQASAAMEQRGLFTKVTSLLDNETVFSYGARLENWSKKDPVSVYHLGFSHKMTKAEVSTGYKAPSLYQLYSKYGNSNLNEEQGTQISVIQDFSNFSVTFFYSRFENLISTTGTFPAIQYVNIKNTETWGSEASVRHERRKNLIFISKVSYQEPRDLDNRTWLPRRPLINGSLQTLFGDERRYGSLEFLAVGPRKDYGPAGITELSGYVIGNLGYHLTLKQDEKIHFRINNIGSSRYEETNGFFSEGLSALMGWSSAF